MASLPKVVGVVGGGQMGAGIAQALASAGIAVKLIDKSNDQLKKAIDTTYTSLTRLASKGKLHDDPQAVLTRLNTETDLGALSEVEMMIEAVPESEELKKSIFQSADKIMGHSAILASNTSSISITRLAAATSRPSHCIGMHFMNPVPIMPLVEIIKGFSTSEETFQVTRHLAEKMGKQTVCSQDRPGFIINRILMPYINEAFFALMEGVSTAEDIDAGMKLGTNVPMGPLQLADFIGLDTCVNILNVLHRQLGEDKYRPCPLMTQYVDAGHLGKKSGMGVYAYKV